MPAKTTTTDAVFSRLAEDLTFIDSVTVGERGQVAIPAELRRQLDITGGAKLFALKLGTQHGFVILTAEGLAELARAAPPASIARVFGAGSTNGAGGGTAE